MQIKRIAAAVVVMTGMVATMGIASGVEGPDAESIVAGLEGQLDRWRGAVAEGLVEQARGIAAAVVRGAPRDTGEMAASVFVETVRAEDGFGVAIGVGDRPAKSKSQEKRTGWFNRAVDEWERRDWTPDDWQAATTAESTRIAAEEGDVFRRGR